MTEECVVTRISEPGEYEVNIHDPYWELLDEKNGDEARMCLCLPGQTADYQEITARLYFVRTIVKSGANKGKFMYEVSAEKCVELGMSEPFSPDKIDELDNVDCVFVVQEEEYKDKVMYKVAFINTMHKKLEPDKAKAMWAKLLGDKSPEETVEDVGSTSEGGLGLDDEDNLPFS